MRKRWWIIAALGGLAFGLYPSRRAAGLDPVSAISA